MKDRTRNRVMVLVTALLGSVASVVSGCDHPLRVKNLDSYTNTGMRSLDKRLSIGMIPQTGDVHCEKLVKGVAEALGRYSADVLLPYSQGSSRKIDVLVNISVQPDYHGSGWNFLINFPGFLIFTPAWNGYVYKVNYDVEALLTRASDKKKIDSFKVPIRLNIRHAAINRTWTEVSWFEVGAIALVSGFVFIGYDGNVSALVANEVKTPIGDYIAQEIVNRINNSGDFAYMIRREGHSARFAAVRLE